MYAYTLTEQETKDWNNPEPRISSMWQDTLRLSAKVAARDYGHKSAEIYSHDGLVLDTVQVDDE